MGGRWQTRRCVFQEFVLDAPAANGHELVAVAGAQALGERSYDVGGAGAGGDEEDAVQELDMLK